MPVSQIESTQAREVENVTVLASVWEDAEGFIHKVALLEGELVEARGPGSWQRRSSIARLACWLMVRGPGEV
jgi:hypothetical protein